ncbi:carbamoyltransferase N-terminal domain-containing protein [Pedobacter roseus]|uniref:Carbamoyltransferase n=1 Tax=Pedobacter roseus TaxID=336820 RepID=A0A7G9QKQ8_9SPHI|nr:carbamoyltransferase N-terminal domain-containing protein [Pedobacter roseus]QNN43933.1 hypothetical protein H9L23_07580 [Pedobacter roseus]
MRICGLKLTHDGAIALIEDNRLVFCMELEKLDNNSRYSMIDEASIIEEILNEQGYEISQIDHFVIDGWGGYNPDELAIQPRLKLGKEFNYLSIFNNNNIYELKVAQYQEENLKRNILEPLKFDGLKIKQHQISYESYLHVTGHVLSSYCTSPFAQNGEDAFVLIWDGGMFPNLYHVEYKTNTIVNLGPLFLLIGNTYTIFSQHFHPFKTTGVFAKDDLGLAGKIMAYVALGDCKPQLFDIFDDLIGRGFKNAMGYANVFANDLKKELNNQQIVYEDQDILRTFHEYMGKMLVEKLSKKVKRTDRAPQNLCLAGGCALNIKWNSIVRDSGIFKHVYVPPFPNDSGSAIGVACAKMVETSNKMSLEWNVYSGPTIIKNNPTSGWGSKAFDKKQLAQLLFSDGDPIIVLSGKAELGPRALGNRSIIAPAVAKDIRQKLNLIKLREDYRPISPICLEQFAGEIFVPGTPDPYMLFDHQVKDKWKDRVPGIVHLDNSSRLQTINKLQNPFLAELIYEYYLLSGIPLICNTSANFNGRGFFPDVYSATEWGMCRYVWCDNTLYYKN